VAALTCEAIGRRRSTRGADRLPHRVR